MTSRSRSSRRESRRAEARGSTARWLMPVVAIVIVGVAAIAIILGQNSSSSEASPGPSTPAAGPPQISGNSLPLFKSAVGDAATGLVAPVAIGHDDADATVTIEPSGRTKLVIFAAHWCSHCQREIPVLQDWIDAGRVPSGVDLVSVSTAIDPTAPNYPPGAWFEREGWTVPVMVDPTGSVAKAYGLNAYPYFVVLDGEGRVTARLTGEADPATLEALLAAVPGT